MNKTYIGALALAATCVLAKADIEQDRAAILNMAGEFKVGFYFKETMPLTDGYVLKDKEYSESAHEKVLVVRDEAKEIELQHLLVVHGEVVKHWSQIWKYEDQELIEYQGHNTWEKRTLSEQEVKGTWSQLVTQTTDAPRYESFGTWQHEKGSSSWTSDVTARPLPRREYKQRNDYDVLAATNRQTITPDGWVHEQDNAKQVRRDGEDYPLCREVGFNTYTKVQGVDFAPADKYWEENQQFWSAVKQAWEKVLVGKQRYTIKQRVDGNSLSSMMGDQQEAQQKSVEKLVDALAPYLSEDK